MNTRLQVEHPVTEEVYGVDLVALQLAVAEGEKLPPETPAPRGHAIEARLYAEDPARGWAPQTGALHLFDVPGGIRLDTGYASGDAIGVHYDPMIAKLTVHAPTRDGAARKLARALERTRIHGPVTNRDLLVASLRHPEYAAVEALDTGFYDRNLPALTTAPGARNSRPSPPPSPPPPPAGAASAAAGATSARRTRPGRTGGRVAGRTEARTGTTRSATGRRGTAGTRSRRRRAYGSWRRPRTG